MDSNAITTLINNEQTSLNKKKQTALARGQWSKAHDCEQRSEAIGLIKIEILKREDAEDRRPSFDHDNEEELKNI